MRFVKIRIENSKRVTLWSRIVSKNREDFGTRFIKLMREAVARNRKFGSRIKIESCSV